MFKRNEMKCQILSNDGVHSVLGKVQNLGDTVMMGVVEKMEDSSLRLSE